MQNDTPADVVTKKEVDFDSNRLHTDNNELFKCASNEPELYECQGCTNFDTNFFVHLQQHIRANHTHQNSHQFQLYECANCDFKTYSKYSAMRHKLFISCTPKNGYETQKSDKNKIFQCEFCPYRVKNKINLLRHVEQNHNEWYRCGDCTYVTKKKSLLKNHKSNHVPEWKECDRCPFFAKSLKNIRQHKIKKHGLGGKWYQCGHCSYKCVYLWGLQQHQKFKHRCSQLQYHILEMSADLKSTEWFQCGQCLFKTRTVGHLRRHNLDKHGLINTNDIFDCTKRIVERYTCAKCDNFQSDFCTQLKKHISEGHTAQDPKEYTAYKCQRCQFTTYSRYLDLRHGLFDDCVPVRKDEFSEPEEEIQIRPVKSRNINRIFDSDEETELWFYCKKCPFKSRKEGSFNKHMVYHGKKFYHCKYCKFKASHRSDLQTHVVQHINDDFTYFKCFHCRFKTLFKGNLSKHLQKHATNWVKCDKCEFKTKYSYNLTLHEKVMHGIGVKWFDCDLCEFRTKRLYNLKLHKKVKHTNADKVTNKSSTPNEMSDESGEEWYHCDQCTFKTKVKPSLKAHQQVHSEKKYKCKYCEHTSKRMYNLKTHVLQKHADPNNIKWLHCEQCDFKSKTKSILKRHVQERHSNEWVYCAQCPFKAKSKRLLISHLRVVHNCGKKLSMLKCEHCPYVAKNTSTMWHHKWKHLPQRVNK